MVQRILRQRLTMMQRNLRQCLTMTQPFLQRLQQLWSYNCVATAAVSSSSCNRQGKMKVVALVSGGKDSCYAMQRCIDYGHEIVALANLLPADDEVDELDSFMFQTVGHQMICAIAQCMGLPLFRRRIQGTSRLQELRYKKTIGDEVEDLEKLLVAVKQKYPEIRGVSSGAIASNYQRLRVESVCSRLDLVSLAYLWEQDQAALLQNMIDSGIHAVLVKVAAIGMDPQKHLGQDLVSVQPHLTRLASLYGSNVCGEGGEYESLTLDSPLFKHARIVLDEFEVALHSPDKIAPVGVLHPTKFHFENKDASSTKFIPDYSVFEVRDTVAMEETVMGGEELAVIESENIDEVQLTVMSPQHGIVSVGCWRQRCAKLGVQEELGLLLSTVEKCLQSKGLSWGSVVYVRLFLNDMDSFGAANEVYVKHITEQKCEKGVPSRCCMQVCLSEADMGGVLLEVTATSDSNKQVLHVQSVSCWAPSCIGPYSQATLHKKILHMAGQLGLDPPTMLLVQGGPTLEMQQSLKNCEAVAGAFKASLRGDAVAITVYCSNALSCKYQARVENCLHKFLVELEDGGDDQGIVSHVRSNRKIPNPLILFVLVPALPKGAKVEVEPSLFVDSGEDDSRTNSSLSWQHVHLDPQTTPDKQSEASAALRSSVTEKRTLICTPCEGLVLPGRYCRAIIGIRGIALESQGLIFDSVNGENTYMDLKELQDRILDAVTVLRVSVFEKAARLSWSSISVFRVYYDAKVVAAAALRATIIEALENVAVYPTLVPVYGCSSSLKSRELVVIDVTGVGIHQQL